VIKDPSNRDANGNKLPFPGNIIPPAQLSTIPKALLQYYPLANVPGAGNSNNFLNLQNNASNKDEFTQRIDFAESAKSSWFGRYSWDDDHVVIPALYLNGTDLNVTAIQSVISNTRILSSNIVNEARFGFNYFHNVNAFDTSGKPQYDLMTQLGLQLGTNWTSLKTVFPASSALPATAASAPTPRGLINSATRTSNGPIAWRGPTANTP
jgi:hypothetical protein